jgi:hypothetical protein
VVRATIAAATPTATQTAVSANPNPATAGTPIVLTAVVTPQGSGTPVGTVAFTVDGVAQTPASLSVVHGLDEAQITLPSLPVGAHTVSANYAGNSAFAGSPSQQITVTVNPVSLFPTQTFVGANPNPASAGSPILLTAVVTTRRLAAVVTTQQEGLPTGDVTFTVDGNAELPAMLSVVNGVNLAQITLPSLPVGTHQVMATYAGNSSFQGSPSQPITLTVNPLPTTDGPHVTSLSRFGFHWQPTVLVIGFDQALDPATAQNVANYLVFGPVFSAHGPNSFDPVLSATYNAAARTVTLTFLSRLDIHRVFRLTINGSTPTGVSSAEGVLLDGANTGHPGSNYTVLFSRNILVGPSVGFARMNV